MDPVSALALANSANTALHTTTGTVRTAWRRLRLSGTFDPVWLDLGLDQGGREVLFTADDVLDIHRFLKSPRVAPILSFLALAVLSPVDEARDDLLRVLRGTYENEVKRWAIDSKSNWSNSHDVIWVRLIELYHISLPNPASGSRLAADIEDFGQFIATPLTGGSDSTVKTAAHLRRMIALAPDLDHLIQAGQTADEIAHLLLSSGHEPMFTHADVEHTAEFRRLYVERTIEEVETGNSFDADQFFSSGTSFRHVLMGNPGAGKTTFMRHLVLAMATPALRDPVIPTVVVRCRDYVSKAWSGSIVAYASTQLAVDLSIPIDASMLETLLVLGKIVVVFDGLDEVTDMLQRAEMVQRVQAFAIRYPVTSLIVTTREVGYPRAPLNPTVFRSIRLREFSIEQIEEYCTKWFALTHRPDLVESFMAESDSVGDLRSNPLLLSLLCVLYREKGTIPANRRGVYADCAELLFKRWDGRRHIRAHGSLPEYGDRLMQEIARWFYRSATAQGGGLEEQVIAKAITIYMEQNLGFDHETAAPAARDFLSFCADRAWLLGAVGTSSSGQRLFRFTHRTFYEFFAAEAFAREANSAADICNVIRTVFNADPTSVLPELLIQSFDSRRDRGAADVMTELCRDLNTSHVLLLRLMDGTILPAYARKEGFERIVRAWSPTIGPFRSSDPVIDPEAFRALMSLNTLAKAQFVRQYLEDPGRSDARAAFLRGWASLQLSGAEGTRYRTTWGNVVDVLLAGYLNEAEKLSDAAVVNWLLGLGHNPQPLKSRWEYLVCKGVFGWTPGILWWSIDNTFLWGQPLDSSEALDGIIGMIHAGLASMPEGESTSDGPWLPSAVLTRLSAVMSAQGVELAIWAGNEPTPGSACELLRDLLALITLGLSEAGLLPPGFIEAVTPCWPGAIGSVIRERRWKADGASRPQDSVLQLARETRDQLPARARHWAAAETNLVTATWTTRVRPPR